MPTPPALAALSDAVTGVPVILFALDRDGVFTLNEGGGLAILGRAPKQLVGRCFTDLYSGEPILIEAMRRALAGEAVDLVATVHGRTYEARYIPLRDDAGAISGMLGLAVDLTAQTRVAATLAEREAYYGAALDALHEGVVRQEADGRITACNPAAERILGLTAAQLAGRTSVDPRWRAIHPDGAPYPGETHPSMQALATGEPQRDVLMGVHKPDGALTWILVNASPLFMPGATAPYAVVTSLTDVTTQRESAAAVARSEARFRALTEQSSDLIVVTDATGRVTYRSAAVTRLLGYPADAPPFGSVLSMTHPDDRARAHAYLADCLASAEVRPPAEVRLRHRDGSWPMFEAVATNLLDDPAVGGIVFNLRDITARKAAEAAQRLSEAQFRSAFDYAAIGMALIALDGRFLQVNRALCALLGRAEADLLTCDFQALTHPDDLAADLDLVRAVLAGEIATYQLEKRYLRPDGTVVWGLLSVSLVRDDAGVPVHFLSQIQDIDARKAAEAQLRHQALHDPLTGLPNRALFRDLLTAALARGTRQGETIGVCFLDLDGFKRVNDTLGHAAGDMLLAAIGARLRLAVRAGDTVARLGGDEFTILLEGGIAAAEIGDFAARLIATIEAPILLGAGEVAVSTSIGIALSPPTSANADALIIAADAAMYRAKLAGRGGWRLAEDEAAVGSR